MTITDDDIESTLRRLLTARGPGKTICPSEAARALAEDWRPLMGAVRRVAAILQESGELQGYQRRSPVDIRAARGPIRLGLPAGMRR